MAEDKDGSPNYLKEAFHWQYNKIGLIGAVAFAVVSGSALPLLLGAGLELMYLSTIPSNSRFQRLVRSWKFDEDKRAREKSLSALFYELPPVSWATLFAESRPREEESIAQVEPAPHPRVPRKLWKPSRTQVRIAVTAIMCLLAWMCWRWYNGQTIPLLRQPQHYRVTPGPDAVRPH